MMFYFSLVLPLKNLQMAMKVTHQKYMNGHC